MFVAINFGAILSENPAFAAAISCAQPSFLLSIIEHTSVLPVLV
jgi:hypothetical protein